VTVHELEQVILQEEFAGTFHVNFHAEVTFHCNEEFTLLLSDTLNLGIAFHSLVVTGS
jgi:hypothetical protein